MKRLIILQIFIGNLLSLIVFALMIYVLLLELPCDSKQPTPCKPKTDINIDSGACDYSIFYSSEDAKIAREGLMVSAYGDEMRFEYEGQDIQLRLKMLISLLSLIRRKENK